MELSNRPWRRRRLEQCRLRVAVSSTSGPRHQVVHLKAAIARSFGWLQGSARGPRLRLCGLVVGRAHAIRSRCGGLLYRAAYGQSNLKCFSLRASVRLTCLRLNFPCRRNDGGRPRSSPTVEDAPPLVPEAISETDTSHSDAARIDDFDATVRVMLRYAVMPSGKFVSAVHSLTISPGDIEMVGNFLQMLAKTMKERALPKAA
jgi:hypothetical protein